MKRKIFIQDYYLDFTYMPNSLNLERRFFVNIQWDNDEYLEIMCEQNSAFEKNGLRNTFSTDFLDIEEIKLKSKEDDIYTIELDIDLTQENIYQKVTECINENTEEWVKFVHKIAEKRKTTTNEKMIEHHINLYKKTNETIKSFWLNFDENHKTIIVNQKDDLDTFSQFRSYLNYLKLDAKLEEKNNKTKKNKI
jgi:hypothetical protein